MYLRTLLSAASIALAAAMTSPAYSENVLRWAAQGDALTLDPHAQNEGPTITVNSQIYEPLLNRGADMRIEPGLATSWRLVEPTVWEFKLRRGVRFHDGTPFTAEDVAFSLARAKAPTSDYRTYIESVSETRIVDPETVQVVTSGPNPILPDQLTTVMMMSRTWAEAHRVSVPQNYKDKEDTYAVRNTNGTGPFRLESREPDARTVMVKNAEWWGLAERPHNVDRLVLTPIRNDATRIAALLSGEINFVQDPPLQDLTRIRAAPALQVATVNQIRTIFLGLRSGGAELASSSIKGRNPLADRRVRQAMYQAIDIEAIRTKVMRDMAIPAGAVTSPGVHGYTPAIDVRLPYDPAESRRLLGEAGYPDGFDLKLDCPNDRYINDEGICQAVVGMLARVGIKARLDAQSKTLHFPKIQKRETDFFLLGWGVPTLDSHYVFSYLAHSKGTWNAGGYSNPALDSLIEAMAVEVDLARRDAQIAEAWKILREDVAFLPLHHQILAWAMATNLDMPIVPNDQPQFRWARFRS